MGCSTMTIKPIVKGRFGPNLTFYWKREQKNFIKGNLAFFLSYFGNKCGKLSRCWILVVVVCVIYCLVVHIVVLCTGSLVWQYIPDGGSSGAPSEGSWNSNHLAGDRGRSAITLFQRRIHSHTNLFPVQT